MTKTMRQWKLVAPGEMILQGVRPVGNVLQHDGAAADLGNVASGQDIVVTAL